MSAVATLWRCFGCGAGVDAAQAAPFACPAAAYGGSTSDVDHVLRPVEAGALEGDDGSGDPFVRYRRETTAWNVAQRRGLGDVGYLDILGTLDHALAVVDGQGFRTTPLRRVTLELTTAAGQRLPPVWAKLELEGVSGSHKARHLMAVMLYLRVLEATGHHGLRRHPLAIASCGNAALGAAVVARAADWPLRVFIPTDARAEVVRRLEDLGAEIGICRREDEEPGDPSVRAFRAAVRDGAIPFSVQGPDNGLVVEGSRILGRELTDQLHAAGAAPDAISIQVGGGALASGLWQGLQASGWSAPLHTLQTEGAAPLARAVTLARGKDLRPAEAARERSRLMWAWETPPHSVAHGILDDETYDWVGCYEALDASGGQALIASEDELERALDAVRATGIEVSATGAAGVAGLLALARIGEPTPEEPVVLLTGAERG